MKHVYGVSDDRLLRLISKNLPAIAQTNCLPGVTLEIPGIKILFS